MQGTIIHYDELTRCGLLRDESGHTHFFRRDELPEHEIVMENQTVTMDDREEQKETEPTEPEVEEFDDVIPVEAVEIQPEQHRPPPIVEVRPTPVARVNWPGALISLAALVALFLSGNETTFGRGGKTPSLTGSVWGVGAALLLVLETSWFVSGAKRWLVRLGFWQIALCSAMAFWMQSCDGFRSDTASDMYVYLLAALFVAAYLLPYRKK